MDVENFSSIQLSIFTFFETKVKKSPLFKTKEKVDKKEQMLASSKDKDKEKKERELIQLQAEWTKQRKLSLLSEIPDWFKECADKAKAVKKPMFKVSHATKFTHGVIPYGGIHIKPLVTIEQNQPYLTTETLQQSYFDITNSNGNLITHARFLMVKLDDQSIYEKLEQFDDQWLFEFTKNDEHVKKWADGLRLWVGEKQLRDAYGLKQNYFYLAKNSYHMLAPLFATALYQAIYEKIRFSQRSHKAKELRQTRKKQYYAPEILTEYPHLAVMKYGGTQPQNITVGNFERYGEVFLLRCAPPNWQSKTSPPINARSFFYGEFDRRAWKIAKELQTYLVKLHNIKSNKNIRCYVQQLVYQLIDILLDYIAEIQDLKDQAGWSEMAMNLKQSHKLWLDPYRDDDLFQNQRKSGEWQAEVCKDFGRWLNKKLEHKKQVFAKIESIHWAKLLKRQLREVERDLEVFS